MNLKLVKKGYDPSAVDEYIKRLREVYDNALVTQRDRIFEQRDKINELELKLEEANNNRELVVKSIESARSKADEIINASKNKYAEEIASLRKFHEMWIQYFALIKKKYPLEDGLENVAEIDKKVTGVLKAAENFVPRGLSPVGFNPVEIIETHLAASEVEETIETMEIKNDNEKFDYTAAANPKDDLKSILADLGIIFDEI